MDPMLDFVRRVCKEERFLSAAQIEGLKPRENRHNSMMHELAKARLSFDCCGQRQSRFALWSNFSQSALVASKGGTTDGGAIEQIQYVHPSCLMSEGQRQYQMRSFVPAYAGHCSSCFQGVAPRHVYRHTCSRKAKTALPEGPHLLLRESALRGVGPAF